MVEGVLSIVMGAFGLVLAFLTYKAVVYGIKKQEKDFYSDWGFISTIVGFTGGGASLVLIVEGFSDGVLRLMNPSYYALQFFMDLIK